ncbi:MAG: restriction endonuclease subunit S [Polaromonas sp.]|uniref:restriction endonuclease subunit S n=1 Tax=Polaromonas sp. TaxID=1869339 RepID=UPI00273509AE|nr:restriction endonuclease subunit S [Polaromonas sp.]MDP3798571.1 restriction endonuclease subunit S [Polaromonas sp.]
MNIETLAKRYSNLPADWKVVPLGDVLANIIGGGTPSRNDATYWGGDIPWLTVKDMRSRRPADAQEHITARAVAESATSIIPADTVITATRVGLGKVVRVPFPATINQDLKALIVRPELDKSYLEYWIVSIATFLESIGSGTTVKGIRLETLRQLPFPLAPLKQQQEIVAEIEKQFSRLDEAVANLKRVKANLKRYKASVLKDAVEGRLVPTEAELAGREGRSYETGAQLLQRILEIRRSHWKGKRNYREPVAPETADLPEVPPGWVWASPEQLSAGEPYSLAIGPFGSSLKVSDYKAEGVPLVFVRNIRAVSFGGPDAVFVTPEKAEELKAHLVEAGDILVTKMGAPPGDVCMYPATRPPAVITADCIKLRLMREQLCASFFGYAIESKLVQSQILGITKGVAQLKVSLGNFCSIAFPLPPLAEQRRIVAEVDRRLSLVRVVEAEVDANLKRAQALRQAVLARTFASSAH